jgi:adenylosuccinate synthase
VYGVAKAYLTRVGEGPFPTELKDATGEWLRAQGHEYGATTKRPRRCGWFDAVAMAYVQDLNGFDGVYLNKIDILTGLKTLYIAVAYDHPSLGRLEHFPSDPEELWACKPVYKSFSGWDQQLPKTGTLQLLPYEARVYIDALCEYSKITLKALGCGPHREDVVVP